MSTIRDGKFYLSLCVCIQLLKIIKFTSALIPKMDLAPMVLKKALADLIFFMLVFLISMFAFSTMFFIQLGPFIADFASQEAALIGVGRALFGDFDIDEILDNSPSYTNALLFIAYLFVAISILLVMFFAILGESQAALRDEQRDQRESGELPPEFGVFTLANELFTNQVLLRVPRLGDRIRARREAELEESIAAKRSTTSDNSVDRIEIRQLQLSNKVGDMAEALTDLSGALSAITGRLDKMRSSCPPRRGCVDGARRSSRADQRSGSKERPPRVRDKERKPRGGSKERH